MAFRNNNIISRHKHVGKVIETPIFLRPPEGEGNITIFI